MVEMPTEQAVREALRTVVDPEVGVNIEDLGLVYDVVLEPGMVRVALTMTSPACPLGDLIIQEAREAIEAIAPGVAVDVALVWEPPWDPSRMSEGAKHHLSRG